MNNLIWIPDKEYEWVLGEIVEDHGENIGVIPTNSSLIKTLQSNLNATQALFEKIKLSDTSPTNYKRNDLCEYDNSHLDDLDDLCLMNNLHEAPLLHILRRRWIQNKIYTYASEVLISVNPYKFIPGLYDNPLQYFEDMDDADEDGEETNVSEEKLPPHAYFIANNALKKLIFHSSKRTNVENNPINQSVIISGESGSGKTEASKHVINFLIRANQKMTTDSEKLIATQTERIKDVILDSSVVFEAFGNAKTVRNDNSSRFGKYIKLQYTEDNGLISATTETFLLEKSRLVSVGRDERNYHVFYQLLRGIDQVNTGIKNELLLTTVDDYRILTSGNCTVVHSVEDDIKEFIALHRALTNVGCTTEDLSSLWSLLATILHLGNASFTEPVGDGYAQIHITSTSVKHVSDLLGVKEDDFLRALTTQSINIAKRSSVRSKTLTATESTNNVLALIKWLYNNIFGWLLHSINQCHSSLITEARSPVKFLGILDIFGFEILGFNSFEQLCINFTNERLQQQFNVRIFASEQELYMKEGINWTTISYQDNQNVIDLIAKKPTGLLFILEEHCMMNRTPDDMALLGSMNQMHGDKPDKIYQKSRFIKDPIFTIKHFAGGVTYNIEGFISKNNDSLQEDLTDLILSSTNPFIRRIIEASLPVESKESVPSSTSSSSASAQTMAAPLSRGAQRKAFASSITVSLRFRGQLDTLIAALRVTEPHYIKCIKPNDMKSGDVFQSSLTMTQLRYSGILEVVRIRREGFPVRIKFSDFYLRYELFSRLKRNQWKRPGHCTEEEANSYCKSITQMYLPTESYQYGNNLLFIREYGLNLMQLALNKYAATYTIRIQKEMRRFLSVKHYKEAKIKILVLQCKLRQFTSKCKLTKLKTAKRLYEEEMERKRRMELARQEAERRRIEEERKRQEEVEREKKRKEDLEKRVAQEAIAAEEESRRRFKIMEERKLNSAKSIIYKNLSIFYRNYKLRKRINILHTEAQSGIVGKNAIISDFKIRWKYRNFDTVLRTAIRYDQIKVIESLKSTIAWDKKGLKGDSLLHLAASMCNENCFHIIQREIEGMMKPPPRPSLFTPPMKLDEEVLISSGWMLKYRPGQRKIRRWCVLKPYKILYFKQPEDKIPRAIVEIVPGCSLNRVDTDPYSFEVESPSLPLRRSMFGTVLRKSMIFIAESELIATDWIYHIQYRLGVPILRKSPHIDYISPTVLRETISVKNNYKETCLHSIIKSEKLSNRSSDTPDEINAVALADWLIVNGINLLATDAANMTVLAYAQSFGYDRWIAYFASKEKSVANQAVAFATGGDMSESRYANIGYTYINIYVQRQYFKDSKGRFSEDGKSMTVSFKNKNNELMEMSRYVKTPVLQTKPSIIWSNITKLRTPIDIIDRGSAIYFDQYSSISTLDATYKYLVKPESIQSGFVELASLSGPPSVLVIEISLSPY